MVLCKVILVIVNSAFANLCPRHFFYQLFIATNFNSLQTSCNSAMKDWPDKYQVWFTPKDHLQGQTCDNYNTRFS